MKKELLLALEDVDEGYLEDARPKEKKGSILSRLVIAASLLLVGATVLTFALLGGKGDDDTIIPSPGDSAGSTTAPEGEEPDSPEINTPNHKNAPFDDGHGDYSRLLAAIDQYKATRDDSWDNTDDGFMEGGVIPGDGLDSILPEGEANGSVIENTDNQVLGIVEGDLMKMTDKFIFRLGEERRGQAGDKDYYLRVYSIEKENSQLIVNYKLPLFDKEETRYRNETLEMYISRDARTLTIVRTHIIRNDENYTSSAVGVLSLDIRDVSDIKELSRFSVEGGYISSRMVDGRLLLLTNQYYYVSDSTDTDDVTDFIPSVYFDDAEHYINMGCIYLPEIINSVSYTTLIMANEGNLEIIDARAFLDYTQKDAYVSRDKIYLPRDYTVELDSSEENLKIRDAMSDITVVSYSKQGFADRGTVTVRGTVKDRYSIDEKDGYLRVVTTTTVTERKSEYRWSTITEQMYEYWFYNTKTNASLYIINLFDNSITASVEGFAPDGEEAAAVRFEGNKLYVCTAVIRLFTDPVFFFDLSDYHNITYTDTGYIEGFSSSLIDLGEGFLLGIGRENNTTNKVEIYKKEGDSVVSVDKYLFGGSYSTEYKSYLIGRDKNLFGLYASRTIYNDATNKYEGAYLLFMFDGNALQVTTITGVANGESASLIRAATLDGYLYITTPTNMVVKKL